jgi:hypothetical protein
LAYLHYGRMAKRRSLVQKKGAAVCTALCNIDEVRRCELGVEAICQLTTDVLAISAKDHDIEAPMHLVRRFRGICSAASLEPLPDLARAARMSAGMLLWMCLARAIELTKDLVRVHAKDRWQEVQEMIVAWQDGWGNDARAKYAQARFTTLTGIVRGAKQDYSAYMHAALVMALSDVQA